MVVPLMIQIADFLNIIIFQSSFIYLNGWSLIHLGAGFLLMKYIFSRKKIPYLYLAIALIFWEIFEFSVIALGYDLFRPELKIDVIFDILFGLVGGWLYVKTKKLK